MNRYDIVIVGGGPAGATAATVLAQSGAKVVVLEEKRMPRTKLCGEFVTPECLPSLEHLGVTSQLTGAGAQQIRRLRLVTSTGRSVEASIAEMSGDGEYALGLSRARLDQILFDRARSAGAVCCEGIAVKTRFAPGERNAGVEALSLASGKRLRFEAPLIIDGSGRNSRLNVRRREGIAGAKGTRRFAMKTHLEGVDGIDDQIELFFFDGGYGGLSRVEGGLFNLCFIVNENLLRATGGEAQKVLSQSVMANPVARERLRNASSVGPWLTVGPLRFGSVGLGGNGVLAVGDAAGMIDPFTGTGIQMALRTGELAAQAIASSPNPDGAIATYSRLYFEEFATRLRAAELLRRIVFSPTVGNLSAMLLSRCPALAKRVLRATRAGAQMQ